jgi:hypothetical protein
MSSSRLSSQLEHTFRSSTALLGAIQKLLHLTGHAGRFWVGYGSYQFPSIILAGHKKEQKGGEFSIRRPLA